jgi:N-acetylneuraminic acid mutarotase
VNEKIYVIGGRIDGRHNNSLSRNEEYDPAKNQWRPRASMPTVRSGITAVSLNQRVFVFGGESTSGTHNQTGSYDPATDRWQNWMPMPTARHGLGAAIIGETIYVVSGGPQPGASYSSVNEAFTP